MAKFLDTTGVSYYLQQIINQAQDTLILISPYLKINERLRQSLKDKDKMNINIRVVYGKSELPPDQMNWLKSLKCVKINFCRNLHAKCYLNEDEAMVTSMNLYEFSQVNNQEMGIYVSKTHDPQLYSDIENEAQRLIRISDEIGSSSEEAGEHNKGFCVRCKKEIPFNLSVPYCGGCYRIWKKYKNPNYRERYCHLCSKDYVSTINKPVCFDCHKQNKEVPAVTTEGSLLIHFLRKIFRKIR